MTRIDPPLPFDTPKGPAMDCFYVYEHWRPDTNSCFYVGLGSGNRAFKKKRNSYYNNVIKKLNLMGFDREVKFFAKGLTQKEAEKLEIERINFWGREKLTNLTDGGDGVRNPSIEIRRKIGIASSLSNKGRKQSDESRKKKSIALKGKPKSEEHKTKLRKPKTEEHKRKLSESRKGKKLSDEHRLKLSKIKKGRVVSIETRKKISIATTGKPKTRRVKNGNNNTIITSNTT